MVPLGIDKEKLLLQLGRLEETLVQLDVIKKDLEEEKTNLHLTPAIERLLQISIEECINVGNHIISGLALKRADTYKEVFTILKEEKILSDETGRIMETFAIFRNRLVHLYWQVKKEEVYSKLNEINTVKKFVVETTTYLKEKLLL